MPCPFLLQLPDNDHFTSVLFGILSGHIAFHSWLRGNVRGGVIVGVPRVLPVINHLEPPPPDGYFHGLSVCDPPISDANVMC